MCIRDRGVCAQLRAHALRAHAPRARTHPARTHTRAPRAHAPRAHTRLASHRTGPISALRRRVGSAWWVVHLLAPEGPIGLWSGDSGCQPHSKCSKCSKCTLLCSRPLCSSSSSCARVRKRESERLLYWTEPYNLWVAHKSSGDYREISEEGWPV